MNQTCKVCGEPAAGFHFGAFTCEGCKSFFGRSYNNLSSISECKNNGKCVIDKKNRTTCKACRLRKCYTVGMSKGGSRYGRRSNWFKIHCLLQEQQQQAVEAAAKGVSNGNNVSAFDDIAAAVAAQQQFSQRNSHLAAASAPHLGYPSYLPDISAGPFVPAAALPFFSMMNSLPTTSSAFQMPPHLLFPGYHPAAAVAAADAAYRSEIFKHRQSIDSAGSAELQSPISPTNHSVHSLIHDDHHPSIQPLMTPDTLDSPFDRESPELCVSGDDDELEHTSLQSQPTTISCESSSSSHVQHIHSPIAIRASPMQPPNPEPAFSAFSPVSLCSIPNESTDVANQLDEPMNQDCPMDLSMKTSRSSEHSDSDILSESSEEQIVRRKYYRPTSAENSESSLDSEAAKRQKLTETSYSSFNSHQSQRGIVCA